MDLEEEAEMQGSGEAFMWTRYIIQFGWSYNKASIGQYA
jgi:hypothetical protein